MGDFQHKDEESSLSDRRSSRKSTWVTPQSLNPTRGEVEHQSEEIKCSAETGPLLAATGQYLKDSGVANVRVDNVKVHVLVLVVFWLSTLLLTKAGNPIE